jgi:signal peptidase
MEIPTSPRRPAPTPWSRWLVCVVILGPVTALVLLPLGLGLERYVMSGDSMGGSLGRGSVAFERVVPVSDLRVGDVITYEAPESAGDAADGGDAGGGGMVTHRVVDIDADGIVTKGDAESAPDPWRLRPEEPTVSRVVFAVPWIGYAYLVLLQPQTMLVGGASAGLLALLLARELVRRRVADDPEPGARSEAEAR